MDFTMVDAVAVSLAVCVLGYAMDWLLKQLHATSETLDAAADGTLLEEYDPAGEGTVLYIRQQPDGSWVVPEMVAFDSDPFADEDPDDLWILQADEPEDDRSDELDAEGRRGL